MKKPILTILTPTWNRKVLLGRLHASLVAQDVPPGCFEWVVVDDGSTDGTYEYLIKLKEDSRFPIHVLRQDNSGKCAALNLGVLNADGEWLSIVDSDDYVTGSGIKNMQELTSKVTTSDVAVIFCLYEHSPELDHLFVSPDSLDKFFQWANTGNLFDTTQVFRVKALREHPYPIQDGENFMAESWVFHALDKNHLSVFRNIKVAHAEYQSDGLSSRAAALRATCPVNAMSVYCAQIESPLKLTLKLRGATNYWRYYFHAQRLNKKHNARVDKRYFPMCITGLLLFVMDVAKAKIAP
jgi:glycosyltransferase involved in cell wall biosynthesis